MFVIRFYYYYYHIYVYIYIYIYRDIHIMLCYVTLHYIIITIIMFIDIVFCITVVMIGRGAVRRVHLGRRGRLSEAPARLRI